MIGESTSALQGVMQQMQASASQANRPVGQNALSPVNGMAGVDKPASFADALMHSIDKIDALKQTAVAQGQAFERGEPGIGINDVVVDMEKAGLAMEMGVQVRNRVVSAYKDIMNMQV